MQVGDPLPLALRFRQEHRRADLQRRSDPGHINEPEVALAPFDAAHVGPVDPHPVSEVLLRPATGEAEASDSGSEGGKNLRT